MHYDSFKHHRGSLRMAGYDYASEGAYFITICTKDREYLMVSEEVCQIVQRSWNDLPGWFPKIQLDEFVVMPNHIHGIIMIVGAPVGAPLETNFNLIPRGLAAGNFINQGAASSAPTLQGAASSATLQGAASSAPTLGQILRRLKSTSAVQINKTLNRQGNHFWQRNYYERIIRNDKELNHIRQYIQDNPQNWDQDPENSRFW